MTDSKKKIDNWQNAKLAIDSLVSHGIKPDPDNYAVWLYYHNGSELELKFEINRLIDEGTAIDESICSALYNRYIAKKDFSDDIFLTGKNVAKEISGIMEDITNAEINAKQFGQTLSETKTRLAKNNKPDDLKSIVDNLSDATDKMEQNTKSLEDKLKNSRQEIDTLRTELEIARSEAITDALTGLYNRKHFDQFLNEQIEKSNKTRKELSMIFGDIDHFKKINDTWGHQTGDQVISYVAGVLKREAPKGCIAARIGGEEFAIIAPNTDIFHAKIIADKIRTTIEKKKLIRRSTNEDLGNVTISLGVTSFVYNETKELFIKRADTGLYKSKTEGRNKTSLIDGSYNISKEIKKLKNSISN